MNKQKSQLRQDLVSGDWIVIAPARAERPYVFVKKPKKRKIAPKSGCLFENPQTSGHEKPILLYGNHKKWELQIIENKYPAFAHKYKDSRCAVFSKTGPYTVTETVGYHDIVITKNHYKNFAKLSKGASQQVFEALRDRYLMLLNDPCISYVSIFHNWGPSAGASIYHPHYQIIAMPIIPPDIMHSLRGSREYYRKHKKCVHCAMIEWEKKQRKRILYENEGAIAFTPFVSKNPFEIRVFPKKHLPYFENTLDMDIDCIVDVLQYGLKKIEKNLKDPDYNFFIHTAPIKNKERYKMYHWHIEIVPKIDISAGFELSTGMEINVVDPDDAVKLLRK
jgi:UDPglucose--hexose-1-phosphate uridylyltransferase